MTTNEEDDYKEEVDRVNRMCAAASAAKMGVTGPPEIPPALDDDGSYAEADMYQD